MSAVDLTSYTRALAQWGRNKMAAWWQHQMETFSALLAICAGNSPVTGEFPTQMPVTWSFDVFLDLRLNKRLSKQSWGWWIDTPSHPLWRHCNGDLADDIFKWIFLNENYCIMIQISQNFVLNGSIDTSALVQVNGLAPKRRQVKVVATLLTIDNIKGSVFNKIMFIFFRIHRIFPVFSITGKSVYALIMCSIVNKTSPKKKQWWIDHQ